MAAPKKLSAAQKALAEKTIKIKYNGLIESLKTTATKVETQNQPLPGYPGYVPAGHQIYGKNGYQLSDTYHFPAETATSEAMQNALNSATLAYKGLKQAEAVLDALVASENARIRDENEERAKKVLEAQNAKGRVAQLLASQRDDAILNVAFQGEDAEMLAVLNAIPGPQEIMAQLESAGFELASALPTVTGIGSRSPKVLNGASEVAIKIVTDD